MQDRIDKIRFIHGLLKREVDELMSLVNSSRLDILETQGPPTDVIIGERQVRIFVDLPGLSPDDFTVYQYEDLVIIEGFRPRDNEDSVRYIRVEREAVRFRRVIRFPFCVNDGETTAKLKDGVLEVKIARCACDL